MDTQTPLVERLLALRGRARFAALNALVSAIEAGVTGYFSSRTADEAEDAESAWLEAAIAGAGDDDEPPPELLEVIERQTDDDGLTADEREIAAVVNSIGASLDVANVPDALCTGVAAAVERVRAFLIDKRRATTKLDRAIATLGRARRKRKKE